MKGNVAFITGGANGIGRAIVKAFLEAGTDVVIADIDEPALASTVAEFKGIGPRVLPLRADLANTSQLSSTFGKGVDAAGKIDYLVNCAGMLSGPYDFLELTEDHWDQIFQVNLKAPLFLMQAFARHAMKRGGGGRIVNISSSSAFRARGAKPAYGSSKGALNTLTRIVAAQLGEHDINVNAIAPGVTNTAGAGFKRDVDPESIKAKVRSGPNANFFGRISEPADIAATAVFLCSVGSRQITGQTIHVSAGTITV